MSRWWRVNWHERATLSETTISIFELRLLHEPLTPPSVHSRESPEGTLVAFISAWQAAQWEEAAAFIDPTKAHAFAEEQRGFFLERHIPSRLTPEAYRRMNPGMPAEVAEWESARHNRDRDRRAATYDDHFARVTSEEELRALAPAELLARWLEAHDLRYRSQQALARQRAAIELLPEESKAEFESMWRLSTHPRDLVPIGHVDDGTDVAHVVFRERWHAEDGHTTLGDAGVITLSRDATGEWRLPAHHDLTMLNSGTLVFDTVVSTGDAEDSSTE